MLIKPESVMLHRLNRLRMFLTTFSLFLGDKHLGKASSRETSTVYVHRPLLGLNSLVLRCGDVPNCLGIVGSGGFLNL